jgi:HD superfamily phosphohydrolase
VKIVRDAVHGDIELDPLEVECLATAEMQRLRGVKQLGTASLVYPTAVHTRFEHSLGTNHVAKRILSGVAEASGVRISAAERTLVGLAALLHDVTHVPYGHTLEDERRVFPRHDDDPERLDAFLESGRLGAILRREGLAKDLRRLLSTPSESLDRPFLGQVVRDTICADLLDYLRRDAFFCGFSQHYDPRLYRYLRVSHGRLHFEVMKEGRLRPDALTEIVNLLRLRYMLSERVYYHHTKIAAGAMISRAVEHAVENGFRKRDLYTLRDDSLLHVLRERFGGLPDVAALLDRLDRRSIHRAAFVLTPAIGFEAESDLVLRFHRNESGERERAEREIAGALRVPASSVIVYCPSPAMALKEADVWVHVEKEAPRSLAEMRNPEVEFLKEKHRALWRFYVLLDRDLSPRHFSRAAEIAARVIGVESERDRDERQGRPRTAGKAAVRSRAVKSPRERRR